ncbi:hypothetical protein [Scytonema sp. PCC 10023]|uniref:hypothetical protein n=1 Tax=Scytonema sp. PCC 10023 TaxID=1680591 RepID=UPI0039C5DF7B
MFTTIARWFFSTPALIVAVSTRLEPRGGLLVPSVFYHKAVLEGRGLYPINLGHKHEDSGCAAFSSADNRSSCIISLPSGVPYLLHQTLSTKRIRR